MRLSHYVFLFEHDGEPYLYNAFTNALARVPQGITRHLENPQEEIDPGVFSSEVRASLIRGGFLVEEADSELKKLKVRNRVGRFSSDSLGLTIAPTLACNFRCSYCFEEPSQESMSEETREAVSSFVVNSLHNVKRLGVCWYGGEPLLALKTIETLSRRFIDLCRLVGVDYDADIISNGYLMTPHAAELLTEKCNVEFWQVTLDGPPEVHDTRRARRGGGPTFRTIVDNLVATHRLFKRVAVRINIDRLNADEITPLLDILEQRGLKDEVSVYLGHVQNLGAACPSFAPNCFSIEEFARTEIEIYRLFIARGFSVSLRNRLRTAVCMADRVNSFLIDQRGNLAKCWNLVGNEAEKVGTVFDRELNGRYTDWLGFDPFEDEDCRRCKILPLCMGGCPYGAVVDGEKECSPQRYNLIGRMQLRLAAQASDIGKAGEPQTQSD